MLGKEKLFSYLDLFGFGEKTGIDLNGEGTGIIFDLEDVGELELVTTAFGKVVTKRILFFMGERSRICQKCL